MSNDNHFNFKFKSSRIQGNFTSFVIKTILKTYLMTFQSKTETVAIHILKKKKLENMRMDLQSLNSSQLSEFFKELLRINLMLRVVKIDHKQFSTLLFNLENHLDSFI